MHAQLDPDSTSGIIPVIQPGYYCLNTSDRIDGPHKTAQVLCDRLLLGASPAQIGAETRLLHHPVLLPELFPPLCKSLPPSLFSPESCVLWG